MDDRETLLSCLQDADAAARAAAISRPDLTEAVAALRLQLAGVVSAAEALAALP